MNNLQDTIQRYLNGVATPAETQELNARAAEQGMRLEEFIVQNAEETFADDFENIDTTQNEFSPQAFYDQRLSPFLPGQSLKRNKPNIIPIKRGGSWLNVAAAIIAVVLTVGMLYYKQQRLALDRPTPEPQNLTTTTIKGKQFIVLPDSSTVILNEGSELSYDESYGVELRVVTLTGEAFFDVKSNAEKKFIVQSGNVTTSVLGTAFNVKAFPGDKNIVVTVARGKVAVQDRKQLLGTLTPNEQVIVSDSGTFVREKVNAEQATAWTSRYIIINNLRVDEAVAMIASRFNTTITLENDNLKACRITASFLEDPKFDTVLKLISATINASYSVDKNGRVRITGGSCE